MATVNACTLLIPLFLGSPKCSSRIVVVVVE